MQDRPIWVSSGIHAPGTWPTCGMQARPVGVTSGIHAPMYTANHIGQLTYGFLVIRVQGLCLNYYRTDKNEYMLKELYPETVFWNCTLKLFSGTIFLNYYSEKKNLNMCILVNESPMFIWNVHMIKASVICFDMKCVSVLIWYVYLFRYEMCLCSDMKCVYVPI